MYRGVAASDGIGIGAAVVIDEPDLSYTPATPEDAQAEKLRFRAALDSFVEKTQLHVAELQERAGETEAEIIAGHALLAQDPYMLDEINKRIDGGACAEQALDEVCDMFCALFEASEEQYMRERSADIQDVRTGILAELLGKELADVSQLSPHSVVVTHNLTPAMTARIDTKNVAAFVTETGGRTSHTAIIARLLEIPAVLSVEGCCTYIQTGDICIVNGTTGEVELRPDDAALAAAEAAAQAELASKRELEVFRGKDTCTADGEKLLLVANIARPDDVLVAREHDAEGIGLFRSEFLFMDATEFPTEDVQLKAYQKVALAMEEQPVIIRTLDAGGDKAIPYLNIPEEENPFLGHRAVRWCLDAPEQFKIQLRALLRASAFGDIKIMIPLISCIDELRQTKALIAESMSELDAEGLEYNAQIEVGAMIETPAASLIADDLALECDFFSIGTNDLIGYTMCVDRGNARVRSLYTVYQPAVLRSIRHIIRAGRAANISVGMCGEAAADPLLVPLLLSFGLNEFSVSPPDVLRTRKIISQWSKADTDALAAEALKLKTASEVQTFLTEARR